MLFFEKFLGVAKEVAEQATEAASGSSSFRVFISNCTTSRLALVQEPHTSGASVSVSFGRLEPGRVGLVLIEGSGENGAAVEFSIGDEGLVLGAHHSRVRAPSLALDFTGIGGRQPGDYYRALPREVVGSEGARHCIEGSDFAAYIGHVVQGAQVVAHVLLGPQREISRLNEFPQELSSISLVAPCATSYNVVLEFVEMCREHNPGDLARVVFLMEFSSLQAGLDRLDLADRVFALDLLVAGFLTSKLLRLSDDSLDVEFKAWHERRPPMLRQAEDGGSVQLPKYESYREAVRTVNPQRVEAYLDAGLILLKVASLQCCSAVWLHEDPGGRFTGNSFEGTTSSSNAVGPRWGSASPSRSSLQDTNAVVMAQHLQPHRKSTGGAFRGSLSMSTDQLAAVMFAAQQCIHDAAESTIRRSAIFAALEGNQHDRSVLECLQHYKRWVPPMRRSFTTGDSEDDGVEICHEAWGAEVFAGLDDGWLTNPKQVMDSLGYGASPYKSMSTNSKSGEFFFFSGDRRFLIKTVSEEEALLLFRMLPGFQSHIQRVPGSLIVRYAGLHRAEIAGHGLKYFSVMVSVFDPKHEVHETYDVKGSTLNRCSKAGEKIGKDENWVQAGLKLELPGALRREVRVAHEQDAAFLASYGVMDYSLLVGIHHCGEGLASGTSSSSTSGPSRTRKPGGGLESVDGSNIYFVGLIDFLIAFGLYKQAEHLLRAAQGHAEDASCVDPRSYAIRQVRFVQDRMLVLSADLEVSALVPKQRTRCKYGEECYRKNPTHKQEFCHPDDPDWDAEAFAVAFADEALAGNLGTLRVTVISAHSLMNTDVSVIGALSDPYVVVEVGLQRVKTPTVQNCLDPQWNCVLRLALDEVHRGMNVDLSVWDADFHPIQGSDDFLGRLQVPLAKVMEEGPLRLQQEKLLDVKQGELSVHLEFVPLKAETAATSRASRAAPFSPPSRH